MNSMKKKARYLLIGGIAVFAFPLLFFSNSISLPNKLNAFVEVYPQQKWILSKGTTGQINSNLMNYVSGHSNNFAITQFDRGEDVTFIFNKSIEGRQRIYVGDTLVKISSSQIQERIITAQGELSVAKANLLSQSTGEKEALIKEAKNKLDFANEKVVEKKVLFDRAQQLFSKNLISQEEYETQKWELRLLEIEVEINKSKLDALTTGVKQETIKLITSQIDALNTELNFLKLRADRLSIVSPLQGVVNPTFSADTLISVFDISRVILNVPIKLADMEYFRTGMKLDVLLKPNYGEMKGELISTTNEVQVLDGRQVVFARVLVDNRNEKLLPGMILESEITLEQLTLWQHIKRFFMN